MAVPDYFDRVNVDLLNLIPPDCRVVLEVGCGAGALAQAYRRVNPGVKWIGWELNSDAGKLARQPGRCDEVFIQDAEKHAAPRGDVSPTLDALIFGDVLEHLRDPWRVLKYAADWLKPGAQILACIPNSQHYTMLRSLIGGDWAYADEGLLDRTHLRFFTKRTMVEMFEAAGLQVFELVPRRWGNDGLAAFLHAMNPAVERMKLDWAEFEANVGVAQFIVRALKPATVTWNGDPDQPDPDTGRFDVRGWKPTPIEPLHIHAVLAEACCARPRILEPMAMMRTVPGVTVSTSNFDGVSPVKLPLGQPSILAAQRCRAGAGNIAAVVASLMHSHPDCIIVGELDDNPESPHFPELQASDFLAIRSMHAIQCSTEPLAEICRQYNSSVRVFPNQIAELGPIKERVGEGGRVCIFFGAQNREADWAPIMPAINRIIAEMGDRIAFTVVHDRKFYDALQAGPYDKEFYPFCDYQKYRRLIQRCDIALLPLEDTPFNACKSDVKFLECAAEGACALMSDVVYGPVWMDENCHCRAGCYLGPPDFETILRLLIRGPEIRLANAERAYLYVRDHRMLKDHYRTRLAWYRELIANKSALDASLLERVPQLRGSMVHAGS